MRLDRDFYEHASVYLRESEPSVMSYAGVCCLSMCSEDMSRLALRDDPAKYLELRADPSEYGVHSGDQSGFEDRPLSESD